MAPASNTRSLRPLVVVLVTLLAFASATPAAVSFPPLTGRVVDDASILSADTKQKLDALLAEHERQTGNQVVVATLKSLQGQTLEQFSYQLGRAWGIGQKGRNNGALLIIAPNERKARIEVGYGLEGTLTDAQSKLVIENILLPAFRKKDYDSGILAGTVTILKLLGGTPTNADVYVQPEEPSPNRDSGGLPVVAVIVILWIVFGRFFWPLLFVGGGHGWRGRHGWGRHGGGFSGGGGSFGGGGASGRW